MQKSETPETDSGLCNKTTNLFLKKVETNIGNHLQANNLHFNDACILLSQEAWLTKATELLYRTNQSDSFYNSGFN